MQQNLIHIGEVIVHGILFDPKNREAWRNMETVENIFRSVPRLFDLLDERGIEYVLVGDIAMLAYIEGRNTQDIDLIIARKDLQHLPEIRIEDDNRDFARGWFGDLRVDFLFSEGKLFRKVQQEYALTKQFAERNVRCATVEGLLLMKLAALPDKYRRAHFDRVRTYEKDVADLLERFKPTTAPLFDELAKHMLPSDVDEIRRIVADIEDRIARQSQRFSERNSDRNERHPRGRVFDGVVDTADCVVWRKSLGPLSDYTLWRTNLGKSLMNGLKDASSLEVAVPEPVSAMMALSGLVGAILQCGRRTRINCIG